MPIGELISKKWPLTLELGLMGLIVSQLIALPIGMYSALRQNKLGDFIGRSFAILCISVPRLLDRHDGNSLSFIMAGVHAVHNAYPVC